MKLINLTRKLYVTLAMSLFVSNLALAHEGKTHEKQLADTLQAVNNSAVISTAKKSAWGEDYFPNSILTTQDGKKVRFFDDLIKDKVVAINFIFTSCVDSCPLETARMREVSKILGDRVGKDIFFYSVSIDPEVDTPEVLKAYKDKFKIGSNWTFLTGDKDDIINIRKKLGLYLEYLKTDEQDDLENHNLNLIIGNQSTGRWMKSSPFENPYILASQLGDWLHNWKTVAKANNSYADAPKLRQLAPGEKLFRTRCSSCHKFGEESVGPDLLAVTDNRDHVWLRRWLKEPDKMLQENDPLAVELFDRYKISMPNMRLSEQDVEDIISYMALETKRSKSTEDSNS